MSSWPDVSTTGSWVRSSTDRPGSVRRERSSTCDEAQRYNENEYEWLRDVHDALDRQLIKLCTFLVGPQELLAQKTCMQIAGKTQIVAKDGAAATLTTKAMQRAPRH
jgi:hypothetical protein